MRSQRRHTKRRITTGGHRLVLALVTAHFEGIFPCLERFPEEYHLRPIDHPAAPTHPSSLSGRALDDDKRPVPGAKVTLFVGNKGQSSSTSTRGEGQFFFADLMPGHDYWLRITRSGIFHK